MADRKKGISLFIQTIQRFGQDLAGLIFISIALITFLGLANLTSGAITEIWASWIYSSFGWGSYFIVGLIGYIGLLILLRRFERFPKFDLKRIIALEVSFFSLLGFLSIFNGLSIERANLGLDGGIIGWGLAYSISEFISLPLTSVLFIISFFLFLSSGLGVLNPISRRLDEFFMKILSSSEPYISKGIQRTQQLEKPSFEQGSSGDEPISSGMSKPGRINTELPDPDILLDSQQLISDESYIHAKAIQIEKTLEEFGVPARVAGYRVGPTVIQYAVEPGFVEKVNEEGDVVRKKVRVSQISTLNRDLALALSVDRLRIEAPIPSHSFVGIEIPNLTSTLVRLKPVLKSEEFQRMKYKLTLALGLDVSGNPVLTDLARMPHLLIAGTTGSGKSVCITSLISCLAMNNSPEELKLAILDPKMVELVRFNGLPHLFGKVETEIDRMLGVLSWAEKEMDDRYRLLESVHARDLDSYNSKMLRRGKASLPKIVIVIDELADLMMSVPDQTEKFLVRLAQMARATGIHLLVATQRPSTDIITGLIKANFPARISFLVATSVDSRVVLDTNGAETLMGCGDMLFLNPEVTGLLRAQCVMVDDREIENIIAYWQNKTTIPVSNELESPWEELIPAVSDDADELLGKAIELIKKEGRASTSWLQRKLRIGFPRAARLMDELEEMGIVGSSESGGRNREILVDEDEFDKPSD